MKQKCTKCLKIKDLIDFHKHKHRKSGHREICKLCRKSITKEYYIENKERIDKQNTLWAKNNIKARRKIALRWNKNNRDTVNYHDAKRRAVKRNALIKGLTKLNLQQIKAIYKKCAEYRNIGLNMHVDHIIPLVNDKVCGLHVPWNLRITTVELNQAKSNKLTI